MSRRGRDPYKFSLEDIGEVFPGMTKGDRSVEQLQDRILALA